MSNNDSKVQVILSSGANLSQIAMLALVTFGYFYTVNPIYQKEKLAEEVVILQNQIDFQNKQIINSKNRIEPLKREKENIDKKLKKLKFEFEKTRNLKDEMESKIAFMEYKYFFPDGTPAITDKQVNEVINIRNKEKEYIDKKNYFMTLDIYNSILSYGDYEEQNPFSNVVVRVDKKSVNYPFTKEEYLILDSKKGIKNFVLEYSIKVLEKYHLEQVEEAPENQGKKLEKWKKEAIRRIKENYKDVSLPTESMLRGLIESYKVNKLELQEKRDAELKVIEIEYSDWESTWDSHKREILKHNYTVLKDNANNKFLSLLMNVDFEYESLANKARREIQSEISNIFKITSKLPK